MCAWSFANGSWEAGELPGLHSNWGFGAMMAGMGALAAGMAYFFHRRGWF